jgi:arabinose-5-phosphate isomerase
MVLKNQSYRYQEREDAPADSVEADSVEGFPFLRSHLMNAQLQAVVAPVPAVTHTLLDPGALMRSALTVIDTEARAIDVLKGRINDAFLRACQLMFECPGRIVVSGMGKSGHIARKIAATLASTGTPAFFVHPGEASHGDLGMITQKDVVLALSNSGETDELLTILPVIKRQGIPLIAMTGNNDSSLAAMGDVHLDVSVPAEACPLGLAPTASTTAALVMGDALAIALLEARGFTDEDFARSHPAGSLGRRLLLHISDIMHMGEQIPSVGADASLSATLMEMTRKGLGMTAIVDADERLLGVFTDGDLRRALDNTKVDLRVTPVTMLMTAKPKTISQDKLAIEAARLMEAHKIHALLVVDGDNRVVGALNIHDLLRARVV